MDEVRNSRDDVENLCKLTQRIAYQAFESGDRPLALKAVHEYTNLTRERRGLTELRGKVSGELNPAKPSQSPLHPLHQMMGGQPIERMMVIAMPKTPEAEAEERRRLIKAGMLPDPNNPDAVLKHMPFPPPTIPQYSTPPLLPAADANPDEEPRNEYDLP